MIIWLRRHLLRCHYVIILLIIYVLGVGSNTKTKYRIINDFLRIEFMKNDQLSHEEMFDFLEAKHELYNRPGFIEDDPISIPHNFSGKEDIEISGFLTATIAWGNRKVILRNANRLMQMMDNAPYDFILNFTESDLKPFDSFVHRTFNGTDCKYFLKAMKFVYTEKGGLEALFAGDARDDMKELISRFRSLFFEPEHPARTEKHVANPVKGSSAKRINMFLRWMVRDDGRGVDFGIWNSLEPSQLYCPLDVHSGNIARRLGLLTRKQNDWKAVSELTESLRIFDKNDPVKYDFSLFGLGVNEKF